MSFDIPQGDLLPEIGIPLTGSAGSVQDLTGAVAVYFEYWSPLAPDTIVRRTATIVDVATGTVKYTWVTADTAAEGIFRYRWVVEWAGGKEQSYPPVSYNVFHVRPRSS